MNEFMTMEDAEWLAERNKDPRIKARNDYLWFEIMTHQPDPKTDEEFFNIPTFIRQEAFKELYG